MGARRFENPLLPDARLREMYTGMVEARLLGLHMGALGMAQEAAWVAPTIGLEEGDLVSVPAKLGAGAVLSYVRRGEADTAKSLASALSGTVSPWCIANLTEGRGRVWAALGLATALRAANKGRVALVFADDAELPAREWKQVFRAAGRAELPLIFVTMQGELTALSQKNSVPGIAVDGADAIAIYRVTQESIVRARTSGGPALVGCVQMSEADPVEMLAGQLVNRRVCSAAWPGAVEAKVRARLDSGVARAKRA